jgi:hypothetical protein
MHCHLTRLALGTTLVMTLTVAAFDLAPSPLSTATAALAAAPTGTAGAPAPAAGSGASPTLLYAQDWNSYPRTRTAAAWQEAAVTHRILVGSPGNVYGAMIPQLHAWNPALKVLVYDLGPYTIAGTSDYTTLMSGHPDYFARDARGNLITMTAGNGSPAFPNNTLMEEGNPGFQAWEAQRVASNIATWGFDGAYIDSMGLGVLTGSTTGVPIDPSTGQAYTSAQWMAAGAAALDAIKAAIGSKFLFSAGLVNGAEYQASSNVLADSTADGFQTNSWMRLSDASLTAWPSPSLLASDLAMVQSLQAQGKAFFAWTNVWTTATPAQVSAWNTYALAAYLLVDNGVNDYYTFDSPFDSDRTTLYPNELAALGAPDGPFTLNNGVYSRDFQYGSVTLNTTTNAAAITTSDEGGGFTFDAFGGVHPYGDAPYEAVSADYPGWSIVVGAAMDACDPSGDSGWTVDGYGGMHQFGGAPYVSVYGGYYPGWDIIRGAVAYCDQGHAVGYTVDAYGGMHPFSDDPGGVEPPYPQITGYWPGQDLTEGIALIPGTDAGYVVDAYGGLHPFNGAPYYSVSGYYPGQDIIRGVTLIPGGSGGYTLDAYGGLHPFGSAPYEPVSSYYSGWDIMRGVTASSATGGYAVDAFGGLHPYGSAPDLGVTGDYPSQYIVVGVVFSSP